MTYRDLLTQAAKIPAGDRHAAETLVHAIRARIDQGKATLPKNERRNLYKLRARWEQRAAGTDDRWAEQGSTPGRPRVRPKRAKHDDDTPDPSAEALLEAVRTLRREQP